MDHQPLPFSSFAFVEFVVGFALDQGPIVRRRIRIRHDVRGRDVREDRGALRIAPVDSGAVPRPGIEQNHAAGRGFDHIGIGSVVRESVGGAVVRMIGSAGNPPVLGRPALEGVRAELEGRRAAILGELRDADDPLHAHDRLAAWRRHLAVGVDPPMIRIVRVPALHGALAVVRRHHADAGRVREANVVGLHVLAGEPDGDGLHGRLGKGAALGDLASGPVGRPLGVAVGAGDTLQ